MNFDQKFFLFICWIVVVFELVNYHHHLDQKMDKVTTRKEFTDAFIASAKAQEKVGEELHQISITLSSILRVLAQSVHMSAVVNKQMLGIDNYNLQPVLPKKTEEEIKKEAEIAEENKRKLGVGVPGGRGNVNPPVEPEDEEKAQCIPENEKDYIDPKVDEELESYKRTVIETEKQNEKKEELVITGEYVIGPNHCRKCHCLVFHEPSPDSANICCTVCGGVRVTP